MFNLHVHFNFSRYITFPNAVVLILLLPRLVFTGVLSELPHHSKVVSKGNVLLFAFVLFKYAISKWSISTLM
jgi:hypothetical protein